MADNISNIGSDGGDDYATIQAWEAATDIDISAGGSGTREIGELRNEAFAESILMDGATTDATNYRWLRSMDGHEFDHTDTTGARMVYSGTAAHGLHLSDEYDRFGGSEGSSSGAVGVSTTKTNAGDVNVVLGNSALTNKPIVSQITAYDSSSAANAGDDIYSFRGDMTAWNCLCYNITGQNRGHGFYGSGAMTCYNCVAYDCQFTDSASYGFAALAAYNCYAGDCGTNTFHSGVTGDYNAADNTDSSIFTNNLQSKAGASQFVSVTGGSEDFHLKSGADLIDAGNDAHNNDFDIDGSFSGTRDDMGIHEYVAAGGLSIPIAMHHYKLLMGAN